MNNRSFSLPLAALGLTTGAAATTGCTPSVVGEWSLTEIELDGEDYSAALEGVSTTDEYDGCTYNYSASMEFKLTIESDKDGLEAEVSQTYSYSYTNSCEPSENYTESDSEDYDAEIDKGDNETWDIEVDDLDWKLECTVDGDEMMCEGDYDGEDIEMVFER
jgi:hypothetical protein